MEHANCRFLIASYPTTADFGRPPLVQICQGFGTLLYYIHEVMKQEGVSVHLLGTPFKRRAFPGHSRKTDGKPPSHSNVLFVPRLETRYLWSDIV